MRAPIFKYILFDCSSVDSSKQQKKKKKYLTILVKFNITRRLFAYPLT